MAAPTPDSIFTVRSLAARIKADSGLPRAPLGERAIRRAIARGELRAARVGNTDVILWRDFLSYVEALANSPRRAPTRPTRDERADRAVRDRIAHERGRE